MATCASQEDPNDIQTNECNYKLIISLPLDRERALHKLVQYIKTLLNIYETNSCQRVTDFYIGKSSVPASDNFNASDPGTWNKIRIQSRWSCHRANYTTMIVLAVITGSMLPDGVDNAEDYCLSLESELINKFQYTNDIMDDRIANKTSDAGRKTGGIAFVLYIAMALPDQQTLPKPLQVSKCGGCKSHPGVSVDRSNLEISSSVDKKSGTIKDQSNLKVAVYNKVSSQCLNEPVTSSKNVKKPGIDYRKQNIGIEERDAYKGPGVLHPMEPTATHQAVVPVSVGRLQNCGQCHVQSILHLNAIQLLKIIESHKVIEDLVQWFDRLQFKEQDRVLGLLKKHKRDRCNQLVARSKTRGK